MSIRPLVLSLALAAPLFAQAGYSINNSAFSCSAALSFASSTGLDAHCTGNFSVTGGTWTSDTKIALSADGSLTLDGVVMTAPVIELLSPQIVIDAFLIAEGGTVQVGAAGDLTHPTRPRPSPGTGGTVLITPGGAIDIAAAGDLRLNSGRQFNIQDRGVTLRNSAGDVLVVGNVVTTTPGSDARLELLAQSPSAAQPLLAGAAAAAVPEPESYALALAAWATGIALARRRKA